MKRTHQYSSAQASWLIVMADVDNFIEPLDMLVRVAKAPADATGAVHHLLTQLDAVAIRSGIGEI